MKNWRHRIARLINLLLPLLEEYSGSLSFHGPIHRVNQPLPRPFLQSILDAAQPALVPVLLLVLEGGPSEKHRLAFLLARRMNYGNIPLHVQRWYTALLLQYLSCAPGFRIA